MSLVPRQRSYRRLLLIALLGVGVPVLVLAGFGVYQTRSVQSFLSETSSEYGTYAAGLVARSLSNQVSLRANAAAQYARRAAAFGGWTSRYLQLLPSEDPLLSEPFLISDEELLRAAQGGPGSNPAPSSIDDEVWTDAFALAGPVGNRSVPIRAPLETWREIVGTVGDTVFVIPATEEAGSYALAPLVGFGGRVVGIAGWSMNAEVLDADYIELLISTQVFEDPTIYQEELMQSSLSLSVLDEEGREVFRSREAGSSNPWVAIPVGGMLPGWRVAVGPAEGSASLSVSRIVAAQYFVLALLVILILVALAVSVRQAASVIQLADSKTSFLANVSHELKTPLALIRLAGETLELGRYRGDEERMKFLQVISRECRRLTHMINNVLNFAKLEAGRKEFHFHTTDLHQLITETLETFERQFEEKKFEVRVDLPEEMEPIEADSEAITQCLVNLIDNAMKYSDDNRYLGVTARVAPAGDDGNHGEAMISVTDRGMGIPAHERRRIFEKFTRAESGLVHNVRGSGLGLSLVQHIMQAHGGRVELQSAPGRGSTFTLVMPTSQNSVN